MRRMTTIILVWLCAAWLPVAADEADAVLGVWETLPEKHGYAHVEISRSDDHYVGKIVWLSEPDFPEDDEPQWAGRPKTDRKNPDPELRPRPILGLRILDRFEYVGDGAFKRGRIYDPSRGKTYRCQMKLLDDGTLRIRGFIGVSLIGRNTTWRRVATSPD